MTMNPNNHKIFFNVPTFKVASLVYSFLHVHTKLSFICKEVYKSRVWTATFQNLQVFSSILIHIWFGALHICPYIQLSKLLYSQFCSSGSVNFTYFSMWSLFYASLMGVQTYDLSLAHMIEQIEHKLTGSI